MLHTVRRTLPVVALFCVLALTLSGCVHVDRSVKLNSDGSGSYTLNLGLSQQLVSLGGPSLVSQLDACEATEKARGASVSKYAQDAYTYWSLTWKFSNVSALNDLLRTAPRDCDTSGATAGATSSATDYFQVARHASGFTTSFHVTGQLNFALDSSVANNPTYTQLLQDARESFAITMPGGISSHTGGTVSGDTITYTVHVNQVANIDVSSSAVNIAAVLPLIGGAVVILIILGAMVYVYRKRSRGDFEQGGADAEVGPVGPDAATRASASGASNVSDAQVSPYPADAPTQDQLGGDAARHE